MLKKRIVKNEKAEKKNLKNKGQDIIETENDKSHDSADSMGYMERDYLKYSPKNAKEEKELLLIKMLMDREWRVVDNLLRIEKLKFELDKMRLEEKVHEKIMAKNPKMKEEWEYNFMRDFYWSEMREMEDIERSMSYDSTWIEEARKMVTVPRYKELPVDFFEYFHFDGETEHSFSCEDDDMDMDDDSCKYCGDI